MPRPLVALLLLAALLPAGRAVAQDFRMQSAVERDDLDEVRHLLDEDPSLANYRMIPTADPPLFVAVEKGFTAVVELLVARGADVNARDEIGTTPLHRAAAFGRTAEARILIAHGANVKAKVRGSETPLYWATHSDYARLDFVQTLVEGGADPYESYPYGATPLLLAIDNDSAADEIAEFLVGERFDPKSPNAAVALSSAAANDRPALVELLLARGCDPKASDERGETPLHDALGAETVRLLVAAGAPLDAKDKDGETPLEHHVWTAQAVFQAKIGGSDSPTAKHEPARRAAIEALAAAGAALEARDAAGRTALFKAAEGGDEDALDALIAKGADPTCRDAKGRTALAAAPDESTRALLRDALARRPKNDQPPRRQE